MPTASSPDLRGRSPRSLPRRFVHALVATVLVGGGISAAPPESGGLRKPTIGDTVRANVYADNWFILYINGQLVAVDSISFIPHNVVSVDILPSYPMTIAVMAKDNADPDTGMEYANTNVGDGGFILRLGDGTVTDGHWKARSFSHGPVDGDTQRPQVRNTPVPEGWFAVDFDDASWGHAREYDEEEIGPKQPFYEADFTDARFIWTDDVKLDNTVIFRHRVEAPPDGRQRPDFSRINDVVPAGPPRGGERQRPPRRPRP